MNVPTATMLALAVLWSLPVRATQTIDYAKAKLNYQLHCQGCHTPKGMGGRGIPRLHHKVGHFLKSPEGRAYLMQVPGTAYSVLDDQDLSEVMNWVVEHYAGPSAPKDWQPYTREETAHYRKTPLSQVLSYRAQLLERIACRQDPASTQCD